MRQPQALHMRLEPLLAAAGCKCQVVNEIKGKVHLVNSKRLFGTKAP